jgi:UDP-GlcNAc:undecaprenyl-phosphate GlcNAc-1-phosphate transferase
MNSNPDVPPWRKAYTVLLLVLLATLLQPFGGTWAWLHNIRWLYVFIVAFFTAQLVTPVAISLAHRFKILDMPDQRKIHAHPIPRLGGLAIFVAVMVATLRNFQFSSEVVGLLAGSSLLYLTGLADDIRSLKASTRLVIQIAASLMVIAGGASLNIVPLSWPGHEVLSGILTVIWLVGVTNAFNFIDGIDGLAAGMAALCALLFFMIAWPTRQSYLAYLTIALSGACLGYLPFNWKPARIFLGDAGSTFLGFTLAGIAVMGAWAHQNPVVALSTPLLILGIPIFDMIYTTISRIKNGSVCTFRQWLEFTGKDHFHHRLLALHLSEKQTVLFILMINLCIGLGALLLRQTGATGALLLLLQTVIIFLIIVVLMLLGRTILPDERS